MNNTRWTPQELTDVTRPWEEFHTRWPERSYPAWAAKRHELKHRTILTPARVHSSDWVDTARGGDDVVGDASDLLDATIAYQQAVNRAFQTKQQQDVKLVTDDPIVLCFPSDWHIGSEGTDLARIKADCELIASHPRLYCALGGDPVDNFIEPEKISASRSQIAQPHVQWKLFRHLVQTIQHKVLWIGSGNHDAWTTKAADIDPLLASLAGIPVVYTREGGYIDLTVGAQRYTFWRKHRPTRFGSSARPTNFLRRMLTEGLPREFDVGVSEHFHEASVEVREWRPGTKVDRVLITCGSYKVSDPHAESLGYYGGGYGVPAVILYPDRRKILPFLHLTDALAALDGVPSSFHG